MRGTITRNQWLTDVAHRFFLQWFPSHYLNFLYQGEKIKSCLNISYCILFFFIYNVCLFCFFCTSPIPGESFPSLFWPCCQPITTWLQHNQRAVGILEDCTAACSWWPEIPLCRQIHAQIDTTAVAVLYKTNPSESPHHCVGIHKVFHWSLFSGYSMCWLRSATHHNQVM